jgi:hypothetical protein
MAGKTRSGPVVPHQGVVVGQVFHGNDGMLVVASSTPDGSPTGGGTAKADACPTVE